MEGRRPADVADVSDVSDLSDLSDLSDENCDLVVAMAVLQTPT